MTSPPAPTQVSAKLAVAASAPVDCVPDVAFGPDQAPAALQAVAFADDQLSVEAAPGRTSVGFALNASDGAGTEATSTVIDRVAVPPAPVHDSVYVLVAVSAPVVCEPAVALVPDHAPEAEQALASVDDQTSVAEPPLLTLGGLALKLTVGIGGGGVFATATVTDCVAVPPAPEQVSEYELVVASAPVDCAPDVGRSPDHAPEAVQLAAPFVLQVKVAAPPAGKLVGLALSVTIGGAPGARSTSTVTVRVALPPSPVQVRVKLLAACRAPIACEPDTGRAPDQAPVAAHEVASVDDQRKVAEAPALTTGGSTLSATAGGASSSPQPVMPSTAIAAMTKARFTDRRVMGRPPCPGRRALAHRPCVVFLRRLTRAPDSASIVGRASKRSVT